jgi:hypothetical protein
VAAACERCTATRQRRQQRRRRERRAGRAPPWRSQQAVPSLLRATHNLRVAVVAAVAAVSPFASATSGSVCGGGALAK